MSKLVEAAALREMLVESEWRCMFAPDEDPATIEAQKAAWPEDMARAERRADAALATFRTWLAENGMVVVSQERAEIAEDLLVVLDNFKVKMMDPNMTDKDKVRMVYASSAKNIDRFAALLSAAPATGLEDSEAP
jgi:hypothetical protein